MVTDQTFKYRYSEFHKCKRVFKDLKTSLEANSWLKQGKLMKYRQLNSLNNQL